MRLLETRSRGDRLGDGDEPGEISLLARRRGDEPGDELGECGDMPNEAI